MDLENFWSNLNQKIIVELSYEFWNRSNFSIYEKLHVQNYKHLLCKHISKIFYRILILRKIYQNLIVELKVVNFQMTNRIQIFPFMRNYTFKIINIFCIDKNIDVHLYKHIYSNLYLKSIQNLFKIYSNIYSKSNIQENRNKWRVDLENFWSNQKMVVELSVVSKFWNDE